MTERVLTKRDLNRALLARQMLLQRVSLPVLDAIERLVGLQAQIPNPPYIGLWTRLTDFQHDDLTRLIDERRVVRTWMMRSTLHLVTADNHQRLRGTLQPALEKALYGFNGKTARALDIEAVINVAKPFIEDEPRTTGDLKTHLGGLFPEHDEYAMTYAVRTFLPLVQIPPAGTWGRGTMAAYTTAAQWLGAPTDPPDLKAMLWRYLSAFGPATVMDFQQWMGMTRLKSEVTLFKPELRVFKGEDGAELLDVPDKPLPDPETPAPLRFIPEYDNLLVSHKDRTRVIADDDRGYVFLSAARVIGTVLVDGFVRATWKASREKETSVITVSPFQPLSPDALDDLHAEGDALARFIENDATQVEVRVEPAG